MRRNALETVMGAVVVCVALMFVYFAYNTAQISSVPGYEISGINVLRNACLLMTTFSESPFARAVRI